MNKVSSFFLYFLFSLSVFGTEPVELTVLRTYKMNQEENLFTYVSLDGMGSNPNMARGLYYDGNFFYVDDAPAGRLIRTDKEDSWDVIEEGRFSYDRLFANNQYLFSVAVDTVIHVNELDSGATVAKNQTLSKTYPVDNRDIRAAATFAVDDMIFSNQHSRSNQPLYHSFEIVDDFESPMVYRNPEETVEFIQNEYDGEEDLRFDDEGYLFWGDRLVAPDGDAFGVYFWGSTQVPEVWRQRVMQGQFIGWDTDDNSYWSMGSAVVVVSSQGELVAEFYGENVNRYTKSQFTMTDDGTLYVLSFNDEAEQFELMKLERFW